MTTIRVALWLLPVPAVRRLAARMARRSRRAVAPLDAPLVESRAEAIRIASRVVPHATCLSQALALQVMLGRSGTPSQLRLGVARDGGGAFTAHAWLECGGRVVIGGGDLERYARLPDFSWRAS